MAFSFEELLQIDRPWISVKLAIGSKEQEFQIRRLSAADSDKSEADYADDYAKFVVEFTETKDGSQSELERVHALYMTRPRSEIMDQILGTRFADVNRRAFDLAGEDFKTRLSALEELSTEEKIEADKALREELQGYREQAAKDITAEEYDHKTIEELVSLISQINVNMKAINKARAKQNAERLYYMLHDANKKPFFPTMESVYQIQTKTIDGFLEKIDEALAVGDLPFESPDGLEPAKPLPSQSTSAAATKDSGKRTTTRRKSSR
jgi:hypothetical protein